ncbi:MAG: cyclic nucleotide-binding domain-containing protein [Bacteroidia bacterium]
MKNLLFDFISKYISLTEEEHNAITSLDLIRYVKKGKILLSEGQKSQNVYLVLKGCIRVYYMIEGEEKTTAFYTELEGLTPHCVLDKAPSKYAISCVEDTFLAVANIDMEAEVLSRFPKFEILCRMFSEQLLIKQERNLDEFKILSPEQRYLNLLKNNPGLLARVPQNQIASYLGIQPQSLSRLKARIQQKPQNSVLFLNLSERV